MPWGLREHRHGLPSGLTSARGRVSTRVRASPAEVPMFCARIRSGSVAVSVSVCSHASSMRPGPREAWLGGHFCLHTGGNTGCARTVLAAVMLAAQLGCAQAATARTAFQGFGRMPAEPERVAPAVPQHNSASRRVPVCQRAAVTGTVTSTPGCEVRRSQGCQPPFRGSLGCASWPGVSQGRPAYMLQGGLARASLSTCVACQAGSVLTGSASQALLLYGEAAAYSDLALSARARLGRAMLLYQARV